MLMNLRLLDVTHVMAIETLRTMHDFLLNEVLRIESLFPPLWRCNGVNVANGEEELSRVCKRGFAISRQLWGFPSAKYKCSEHETTVYRSRPSSQEERKDVSGTCLSDSFLRKRLTSIYSSSLFSFHYQFLQFTISVPFDSCCLLPAETWQHCKRE